MSKFNLSLTRSEAELVSKYIKKQYGKLNTFNFSLISSATKEFDSGRFYDFYNCSIELDGLPDGELFDKSSLAHKSLMSPDTRTVFDSRSKFVVVSDLGVQQSVSLDSIPRNTKHILNKLSDITKNRSVDLKAETKVPVEKFLVECDALLNRFYYINKSVDLLNATSDAVFDFCTNKKPEGYKQSHWVEHLKEHTDRQSAHIVLANVIKVIQKNPNTLEDDLNVINSGFVSREQSVKLAGLVESALLSTSISLSSDFCNELSPVEEGKLIMTDGIILGVGQVVKMGKVEHELRLKTADNKLIKMVSGSECFGGLIKKSDLINCVQKETMVSVEGVAIGSNQGLKIGNNFRFPPSVTIKAQKISFELEPSQQNIVQFNRKFGG